MGNVPIEVKPGHEDDAINAQLPFFGKHNARLFPESTCGNLLMTTLFGLKKLLTFREEAPNDSNANRNACCSMTMAESG